LYGRSYLRDVRELGREVAHLLVRLLRVEVAGVEVRHEAGRQAGRVVGDPLPGVERVDVAVRRRDLDARGQRAAVPLVAQPEDGVVILVVVRVHVRVDVHAQVAPAEAGAGGVVPLGHELRARVRAAGASGRVGARDLGLRRVGLDREKAPDVVLEVVRPRRPDRAGQRALAALARGIDLERGLGRLLVVDRLLALGPDLVDVVLVVDRLDGLVAVRLDERQLLVGDPRAHKHATVFGGLDRVVHAQAERLELVDLGLTSDLELDQRRIVLTGERRTRHHQQRRGDRDGSHP
jgi:hypothetical protein